jgi:hypothetical protein
VQNYFNYFTEIEERFQQRRLPLLLLLLISACPFLISNPAHCQAQTDPDRDQIQELITKLASHTSPDSLLDPSLPEQARIDQLRRFANSFELSLTPEGPIEVSGSTARASERLKFESSSATSNEDMEKSVSLTFVKRNGQWYFANYDFLKVSTVEIVIFICGMLFAATWTFFVLRKWRTLRKKRTGPLEFSGVISDYFHSLNPFSWFRKD